MKKTYSGQLASTVSRLFKRQGNEIVEKTKVVKVPHLVMQAISKFKKIKGVKPTGKEMSAVSLEKIKLTPEYQTFLAEHNKIMAQSKAVSEQVQKTLAQSDIDKGLPELKQATIKDGTVYFFESKKADGYYLAYKNEKAWFQDGKGWCMLLRAGSGHDAVSSRQLTQDEFAAVVKAGYSRKELYATCKVYEACYRDTLNGSLSRAEFDEYQEVNGNKSYIDENGLNTQKAVIDWTKAIKV